MRLTIITAVLAVTLTLVLIILRLSEIISWPWGWVFSPLWLGVIGLLFFIGWILDL